MAMCCACNGGDRSGGDNGGEEEDEGQEEEDEGQEDDGTIVIECSCECDSSDFLCWQDCFQCVMPAMVNNLTVRELIETLMGIES